MISNTLSKLIAKTALGLTASLLSCSAFSSQSKLIVLSTFSKGSLEVLAETFEHTYPDVDVEFIYRRTKSSVELLSRGNSHDVDLILTSSPLLIKKLLEQDKISPIRYGADTPDWLEEFVLLPSDEIDVFAYSGAGIVWNDDYLKAHQLPVPGSVIELTNSVYIEHVTMAPPGRSGTTQLMLESLLTKYGWEEGWRIILNIGANLGTVSSRSFTVSDYVAKGEFGLGITIDTHALLLQNNFDHLNFRYADDFTLFPTYLAKLNKYPLNASIEAFVSMVHSKQFQTSLAQNAFSKSSLTDKRLHRDNLPVLNLNNMMEREELVNLIFDIAVTERLPALRELWLSLAMLDSELTESNYTRQIKRLKERLFSLPITETDMKDLAAQIKALQPQESARRELLTTRFSHNLARKLRIEMEAIEQELLQIKADSRVQ